MHVLEGRVVRTATGEQIGEEVEDLFLVQRIDHPP